MRLDWRPFGRPSVLVASATSRYALPGPVVRQKMFDPEGRSLVGERAPDGPILLVEIALGGRRDNPYRDNSVSVNGKQSIFDNSLSV